MRVFYYSFLFSFLLISLAAAEGSRLCGHIFVVEGKLDLNENEKSLVCGSSRGAEAWKQVPLPQARLHLSSIVQNLGFLSPKFERDGDELRLWLGPLTKIKNLNTEGDQRELDPSKKRKIVGAPMTPEKLNEVQAWANLKLKSQGHACPIVAIEAQRWDGNVLVKTQLNGTQSIAKVMATGLDGLNPDIFDRYRPFEVGDKYDIRKTQILTSRLLSEGLFQSAFFIAECNGDAVNLDLQTSIGKPKMFRFGIGASTEEFPFVDITFKNSRLDNKASSFTSTLHVSPLKQRLTASSELYVLPGWHRTYLGPRFTVARIEERSYQENSARVGGDIGRNWDIWGTRFNAKWGPTLNYVDTIRGVGPEDAKFLTLDASVSLMSHLYEYYIWDQYEGWNANFLFKGQREGLESKINLNRYELNFKNLWNLGNYSPPLFVLGTRFQGVNVATDAANTTQALSEVPIDDRVFAGGDDNVRGFSRKSLDNARKGYLTMAYLGFELRLIEQIRWRIQPLLLYDVARLGLGRETLDPPLFTSWGAGVRWPSPFGVFYATAAKGEIVNGNAVADQYTQEWVYFLSFGQGF